MAESKFTPGPWRVEKSSSSRGVYRVKAGGIFLCAAVGRLESGNGTAPGETRANAELMADAPRLLEVLRGIRDAENNAELYLLLKLADALLEKHGG